MPATSYPRPSLLRRQRFSRSADQPAQVVPKANRRPRTVCNLTFMGVNDATVDLAHADTMQFGPALRRILYQIYRANLR